MAGEWIECTLADACSSIDYGLTASASAQDAGPRFLRITDIVSGHIDWNTVPHVVASGDTTEKYRLHDGDIVLARTGASTGASAYVKIPPPAVFASYLVRLKAKPEFAPRFLAYFLRSDEFWTFIRGVLGDKSAQPNASASTMTKAPFRAPRDRNEQRAIAHILGTLDDKIELNRRMNETLEAMARALFKSWFVDFDPVRVKVEGRDPGLPKAIADLFPDRLVESELGEIPDGWEVGALADFVDVEKGLSYKGDGLVEDGGLPMINLGCFAGNGQFKVENIKRYSGEYKERHLVSPGDLVIANTDMTQNRVILGSPAFVPQLDGEQRYLFTHHTFAVRFKPRAEIWRTYVYFTLLQPEFREIAEGFATGTTVLALPRDGVLNYALRQPPEALLVAFETTINPMLKVASIHRHESSTLASLRDTLLPKLISGELGVEDADRFVGTL